ncbi:hypothetical protein [Priestia endophytica]|uniref:hypothetical protein n=1 Tax=Priestia endophytica TaxID=135735 RepID=UPI000DCA858A|nr:hypothetical protein [Priestia endophytica]RAS76202.1 hypothetical protein A4R27_21475 [Priestia endophytica]
MKKIIGTVVFALAITGVSTSVSASSSDEYTPSVKNIDKVEYIDGEQVEVNGIELTVKEIPTASMGVYATGKRNAKVIAKKPLFAKWYATATSDATYKQKEISAKVRAYKGNGVQLGGTKSQTVKNSTYAAATVYPGNSIGPTAFAIGNHGFIRSGYVDWFPQTKKPF